MIPYAKPSITDLEVEIVLDAISDGWGDKCYDYIEKFEQEFARKIGANFGVATSSCTGALHLGLAASGITAGDEVIMADLNWIATAAPVVHLNAAPVFVDIDLANWCIDPLEVEKAITPKTKAIIVTHLYGNVAEINALREISREHSLLFVEDAAEALGSYHMKQHVGTQSDFGVFSFHGTKSLTTGEGGMLVTDNFDLFKRVKQLNNHGRSDTEHRHFWSDMVGYKYRMSNLQAALGYAQLLRFDELIERKQKILRYYKTLFASVPSIEMNVETSNNSNGAWMPTIFWNQKNECRDDMISCLRRLDIDARPTFWPLSGLGMFRHRNANNPKSEFFQNRSINLPSFHEIKPEDQVKVADVLKKFFKSNL